MLRQENNGPHARTRASSAELKVNSWFPGSASSACDTWHVPEHVLSEHAQQGQVTSGRMGRDGQRPAAAPPSPLTSPAWGQQRSRVHTLGFTGRTSPPSGRPPHDAAPGQAAQGALRADRWEVCVGSPARLLGLDSSLLVEKLSLFFLRSTRVTHR